MTSQNYPDDQEDPWEREYAYYLERRMEEQYWEEMEQQYEGQEIETLTNSEINYVDTHPDDIAHRILHLPLEENDADAATVGEYLGLLLSTLWLEADGFSGKRPFGNSDWQYVVYKALAKAGIINLTLDEHGYIDEFTSDEEYKADDLILQAIRLAYNH